MSHTAPNSTLASSTLLASYSLGWDPGGRLVSTTSTADQGVAYTYDRNDQLKSATYEKPAYADLNFSYDANGNRTGGGNTPGPDNRQASDGVSDFAYDLDGNMTRRTDKTTGAVVEYAWDLRNRLTDVTFKSSATGPATKKVHYTYDALNRRIGKSVDTDGNGTLDQVDWFANRGLRTERENAGDEVMLRMNASGNVTSRYLHGASVDEILAEENIAADGTRDVLWPLADQQGSVRDIARRGADGRATIVNHVMYGPFGEKVAETDTAIAHLYGYTGREYDQETGLQYNRARYYDPKLGRFISQDPMGFDAGDANLYRMTGNHSTYATDPSGMFDPSLLKAFFKGVVGPGYSYAVDCVWPNDVGDFKRTLVSSAEYSSPSQRIVAGMISQPIGVIEGIDKQLIKNAEGGDPHNGVFAASAFINSQWIGLRIDTDRNLGGSPEQYAQRVWNNAKVGAVDLIIPGMGQSMDTPTGAMLPTEVFNQVLDTISPEAAENGRLVSPMIDFAIETAVSFVASWGTSQAFSTGALSLVRSVSSVSRTAVRGLSRIGHALEHADDFAHAPSKTLTHLTSKASYEAITQGGSTAGKIGGKWGIFALDSSKVPNSLVWRSINTFVAEPVYSKLLPKIPYKLSANLTHEILVPSSAMSAFKRPFAWGPVSAYRRWVAGVHSTPLGSIDVNAGAFVRGEIFKNGVFRQATRGEWMKYYGHQFVLDYGIDAGLYGIAGLGTAIYVGPQGMIDGYNWLRGDHR